MLSEKSGRDKTGGVNTVLLKYFIRLDYRDKEQNTFKKFIGIIIAYIIGNAGLSLNYYMNFDADSFSVLCFTMNTLMLAFISMGEYPQLFFAKEQFELIQTLPIEKNSFITSKFISAFLYLLSFAFILSISQSVFYFFYCMQTGTTVLFLVMNILFSLFFSSFLLIIYSIALKIFSEKGTYVLFFIQVLFFGVIMYSTSAGSEAAQMHSNSIMNFEFIKYLPQKYFAMGINDYYFTVAGFVSALFMLFFLLKIVSKYFEEIYYTLYLIKPKERKIGKFRIFDYYTYFVENVFVRDKIEKTGFKLAKNIITGSKSMLLRYLPLSSAPFIIALLGIISGNESLTFLEMESEGLVIPVLSPSITMIFIMMSRMFISNLQIADENSNDVKWIYESLPLESPARIYSGSFKFVFYTFISVPLIFISIILLVKYPVSYVIPNILYVLSFTVLLITISFLFVKNFPFTLESNKINSAIKLLDVFVSILFAIGIFVLQFFVFQNNTYIFISIITILLINFLITKQIRNYGTGKKYSPKREQTA